MYGAIQLAGCAWWARQGEIAAERNRVQRVQSRTDEIVWKDLVPKYAFQHSCEEVSDAVVQFVVKEGYDVATQSKTQVVTEKKYRNSGRQYDPPEQQQTTVVIAALQAAGAGCRIEITTTDRYGLYRPNSGRAPNWELMVIEKMEPERAQAMRAEATQRAEAENPPKQPVAKSAEGDENAPGGDAGAARPPEPELKAEKQKPAAVAATEGEQGAGASEAEAPPPTPKKKRPQPIKMDAEESSGPTPIPPTLEIAGAPVVALNRSLTFADQKTNTINASEPNMRPYALPYGPAASLSLVWYPLAAFTHGAAQHIGLEASIQQGFFIQTTLGPDDPMLPNATFGTTVHEFEGGARYRIPFSGNQAWFSVTGGEHAFVFTNSPSCALSTPNTCRPNLDIPDTIYRYVRPGIGVRLELPASFALAATAGFRYIFNDGGPQFGTFFPHRTVYGVDAALHLGYRVIPSLEVRLGGEIRRYGFAMNSTMADAQAIMAGNTHIKVAASAVDRYIAGTLGVAFLYGGR